MTDSRHRPTAMISSTVRDLAAHRNEIRIACERVGVFPRMMEQLPSRDADAIRVSLEMVDKADIYILTLACRYGWIPSGHDISITEMEFDRALARGIPILVFLIHSEHLITADMVEADQAAQRKLQALKDRASTGRIRTEFKSAIELRGEVIHALYELVGCGNTGAQRGDGSAVHLPLPPEPFVAHPYALLSDNGLVGRREELLDLRQCINSDATEQNEVPVSVICDIGGMGKSALAWTWFTATARSCQPPAAAIWWSFYEPNATFENFVLFSLAYLSRQTVDSIRPIQHAEREARLLDHLDKCRCLVVLDGVERLLIAYSRLDAAHLSDEWASDVSDGLSRQALRRAAEPDVGRFLRRLAALRSSRTLITTRLLPRDLETDIGTLIPGCRPVRLREFADEHCLELWKSLGCSGSMSRLIPAFDAFGRHPLLIRALAAVVARYRRAPGDFDKWLDANPDGLATQPATIDEARVKVLQVALADLPDECWPVLRTLAVLRMSANYDLLASLHSGSSVTAASEKQLDTVLSELEERGLMGWERQGNRYDLHPVVRGFLWQRLRDSEREATLVSLTDHFSAYPSPARKISCKDDLRPTIELFSALAQLRKFDEAFQVLCNSRYEVGLYRYLSGRECVGLLSLLFPRGIESEDGVANTSHRATALCMLSNAYRMCGDPRLAEKAVEQQLQLTQTGGDPVEIIAARSRVAWYYWMNGKYWEGESTARMVIGEALQANRRYQAAEGFEALAVILAARGDYGFARLASQRAIDLAGGKSSVEHKLIAAHIGILESNWDCAAAVIDEIIESNAKCKPEDITSALLMRGEILVGQTRYAIAESTLRDAIARCKSENRLLDECVGLIDLAACQLGRNDITGAKQCLDDAWPTVELAQTPIEQSKAFLVLSRIEARCGRKDAAIKAATDAFRSSWCQGPLFSFECGTKRSRERLHALGSAQPTDLPVFARKPESATVELVSQFPHRIMPHRKGRKFAAERRRGDQP